MSKSKHLIFGGITFIAGLVIGSLVYKHSSSQLFIRANYLRQQTTYKFIAPLLDSEYDTDREGIEFYPFEKEIKSGIQQKLDAQTEVEASVYFNDLTNLSWVGVNEQQPYNPASLIKLPLMMGYYKLAETQPDLLKEKLTLEGTNFNVLRNITGNNDKTAELGQTYSVSDLIKLMIVDSDNNALELLYNYKKSALQQTFADLGLTLPDTDEKIAAADFISPKQYATFLEVLYNASYLNAADSEAALQLLSQVSYKDGLVAGVPQDVVVSHKFGERKMVETGKPDIYQLHDCGIVYKSSHPYLLCVTTRGSNFEQLQSLIKDISHLVYDKVPGAK